jgi:hypothetical protein
MEFVFTLLVWIAWMLAGLLGVLVFLASMPYTLRLSAAGDKNRAEAGAYLGWPSRLLGLGMDVSLEQQGYRIFLLGLAVKSGSLGAFAQSKKKQRSKKRPKKEKKKKQPPKTVAQATHYLRMPHLLHLFGRVPRWLYLKGSMSGRIGSGDPALTGQMAVLIVMIQSIFPGFAKRVELDFDSAEIEGQFRLSLTVWIPRIVIGALIYLVSWRGRAMVRHYFARPSSAKMTT